MVEKDSPFVSKFREKLKFKPKFEERYRELTDFEAFKTYSLAYLRKCIRVNTLKIKVPELKKRLASTWKLTPVPWCKEGFWIEAKKADAHGRKRRDIGNLVEHPLGYIYVQEAASMIPPIVLNPKKDGLALDLCAAPGSKTTQIAQYMKNTGLLIANDIDYQRIAALGINLQRCGVTNTICTQMRGHWFGSRNIEFDYILADVVCSGTGTIRKSLRTLDLWSPGLIKRLVGQQRQLAKAAFSRLKVGGTMVYSTCTMEPEENEGVIDYLLNQFDDLKVEKFSLPLKRSPCVDEFNGKSFDSNVKNCLRIWPQDNDTEGFFVAKLRKV